MATEKIHGIVIIYVSILEKALMKNFENGR